MKGPARSTQPGTFPVLMRLDQGTAVRPGESHREIRDRVDAFLSSRIKSIAMRSKTNNASGDYVAPPDRSCDILIPIYNAYEHLQRCIESVLGHTQGNHAIYLLDDCNTDSPCCLYSNPTRKWIQGST